MFGANGVITQAEFRQRALERFDRMDLDRNGVVTAAERQQARAQMKQQMQQRRAQ
jgi:23S rRNA-/tRNA-specific pseudouridylate synthase